MKVLFLDCFSGISGDMTVGALCDLGVKPSTLEWELSKVEIGDFHMHFERQQRKNVEGVAFSIHEGSTHVEGGHEHCHDEECHGHTHEHEHGHSHGHEHAHAEEGHKHEHDEKHEHSHSHGHGEEHEHGHSHSHEHGEGHEHDHGHSHEHSHEHAHSHEHEHGHRAHAEHDHEHGDEVPHTHKHYHEQHEHDHDHGHGHHVHGRSHRQIRELIEKSELSDFVKKHALSIFQRIAVAEGKIHGMPAEDVAFHEVGALDSIADIICACVAIEALKVEKVYVSALHDGQGWIDCAHGRFPLPAPATMEILTGIPLAQIEEPHELITPTGAAIVAEFGTGFGPMPRLIVEKIGYGVGGRDLASRPNVLRAVLGELAAE